MLMFGFRFVFLFFSFCLMDYVVALKCRTGEETQTNEDFEYVVRMCLRQMKNNVSHQSNFDRKFQSMFDVQKNGKDQSNSMTFNNNGNSKNYNYKNQWDRMNGDGFEYFRSANIGRNRDGDNDRDQRTENERSKIDRDYMEDSDYFHINPINGRRIRPRPHSYQQQIDRDRDTSYGYGHRESSHPFQNGERSKNSKRNSNRDRKSESPLEQLDPCLIRCIFQEMQMLDENGKPDKRTVSEKMSQKIRNPDLKSFVQDSVDECFDEVDEDSNLNREKGEDVACLWSKNFAICLEEKGKESCDDWNEPVHRSSTTKGKDDQKNKNKNGKGGNNRG